MRLAAARSYTLRCYEKELPYGSLAREARSRTVAQRGVGAIASTLYNFQGPAQPSPQEGDPGATTPKIARSNHWDADRAPYSNTVWVYVRDEEVEVDDDLLPDNFRRSSMGPYRRVAGDWANTDSAERVLTSVPGVVTASVVVEDDEVVADLSLEPGTELFDVHERVLTSLSDNRDVVAPSRYRPAATGDGAPGTW